MKASRSLQIAFLFMLVAAVSACDSNKKSPEAGPQTPGAAPAAKGAGPVSQKDAADARSGATRVIAQMKGGEYSTMYKESSAGFKQIGTEPQFVGTMEQTRKKTGAMKDIKELGTESGPDKRVMIYYSVQYDNIKSKLRLSFLRGGDGRMELVGLNQKDDVPPKAQAPKGAVTKAEGAKDEGKK